MLSPDEKKRLTVSMTVNKIVWSAMFASLFVYVVLVNVVEDQLHGVGNIGDSLSILVYALMGVSVITAGLIRWMLGIILAVPFKTSKLGESLGTVTPASTSVEGRYATALIVVMALAESIAVYGLVLFIMGVTFEIFYLFVGASALLMLLYRPKMSELEDLATAVKQYEHTAGTRAKHSSKAGKRGW